MPYFLFLTQPIHPFFLRRKKTRLSFSDSEFLTLWQLSPRLKQINRTLASITEDASYFISSGCHLWPKIARYAQQQNITILDGSLLSPYIAYQLSISYQKEKGIPLCDLTLNLQGSPLFLYRYLILAHPILEHVCFIGDDSLLPLCEQIYMEYGLPVVLRHHPKDGIVLSEFPSATYSLPTIALKKTKFRGTLPIDPAIPLTLPVVEAYCHSQCKDCLPVYKTLPLHPYLSL